MNLEVYERNVYVFNVVFDIFRYACGFYNTYIMSSL